MMLYYEKIYLWRLYWSFETWLDVSKLGNYADWRKANSEKVLIKKKEKDNWFQSIQYQGTLKGVNNIFLSGI